MSIPIETNTEELQEILQTVYNLPMAGGGSAEPDLVIGMNCGHTWGQIVSAIDLDKFSILSGSLQNVVAKLQNDEKPRVLLKEYQTYSDVVWSKGIVEATGAYLVNENNGGEFLSDNYPGVAISFHMVNSPGYEYTSGYSLLIRYWIETSEIAFVTVTNPAGELRFAD